MEFHWTSWGYQNAMDKDEVIDQARIGTLGIKPKYITEIFVDKENADMALHIVHTLK